MLRTVNPLKYRCTQLAAATFAFCIDKYLTEQYFYKEHRYCIMALRKERSVLGYDPILLGLSTAKEFDSWLALMRCLSLCLSVEHFKKYSVCWKPLHATKRAHTVHFHTVMLLVRWLTLLCVYTIVTEIRWRFMQKQNKTKTNKWKQNKTKQKKPHHHKWNWFISRQALN